MVTSDIHITPIGTIKTPFKTKYGAPRQPASASEKSIGVITLLENKNFEQALEDIKGFDYIWVIFWFHKNSNWKPMVLPPHGKRKKRGLFSTRSPHRPNPIGLSLCKLIDVKGRCLTIENPDMLDGTPILDIKPYIPHAESFPDARGGWIEESNESTHSIFSVAFTSEAKKKLRGMEQKEQREILAYLTNVLSRDPHPHSYRRIKILKDGTSIIAVQRWRFTFRIREQNIEISDIEYVNE